MSHDNININVNALTLDDIHKHWKTMKYSKIEIYLNDNDEDKVTILKLQESVNFQVIVKSVVVQYITTSINEFFSNHNPYFPINYHSYTFTTFLTDYEKGLVDNEEGMMEYDDMFELGKRALSFDECDEEGDESMNPKSMCSIELKRKR